MKKIAISAIAVVFFSGVVSAQDDISIMDLKETTYYLMKDVNDMKEKQGSVLKKVTEASKMNDSKIESMQADIKSLQSKTKTASDREIVKNYRVSAKLTNYLKN